jgi:hypothetical protein
MTILQTIRTRQAKRQAAKARVRAFRSLAFWSGVALAAPVVLASVATLAYLLAAGVTP